MSEAEITFQISEILNRLWVMQQWWASVSIGVLVMAHLASSRLNLLLIIISLALYTSYTLYMHQMSAENVKDMQALAGDMQALIDSGVAQSNTALRQVQTVNADVRLYRVTFLGTYLCVVIYLIYSYTRSRKSRSAEQDRQQEC